MKRWFCFITIWLFLFPVFAISTTTANQRPPGISFATLLNNVRLQAQKGLFDLGNQMQGVFIEPGTEGWTILRTANGVELYKFNFRMEALSEPYTLFDFYETIDLRANKRIFGSFPLKEAGDYVLDFYLASGKFYSFPFSVQKSSPSDPFYGGDLYFLNGNWSDWAYLYYQNADPEQNLFFKVWVRHQDHSVIRKDAKIRIEIIRNKDKKLLCTSRDSSGTLPYEWNRFEFDMAFPTATDRNDIGEYFKTKHLLAVDGDYTIKMTINGALYGTWYFSVVGGKLSYTGRTERGKADPLSFIEGGRDAWWYQRR